MQYFNLLSQEDRQYIVLQTSNSQLTHAHYCARTAGTKEDKRAKGEEEPVREKPLAIPLENPVQQRFANTKQTNPFVFLFFHLVIVALGPELKLYVSVCTHPASLHELSL